MTSNPLIRRLQLSGILSQMEQDAIHDLTLKHRYIKRHEDITNTNYDEYITVIISGIACRYKLRPDGQRRIVSFMLPGDLCDLRSPTHFNSDWHLGALTDCRAVDIQRQVLENLAAKHQGIARGLWWATLVELEIGREWIVNDSRPADRRLGYLFCELMTRLKMVGLVTDNSYDLRLTQVDLADATAISFVHMNRIMQSLRGRNLINYQGGFLKIPDIAQLKEFSEFNHTFLNFISNI